MKNSLVLLFPVAFIACGGDSASKQATTPAAENPCGGGIAPQYCTGYDPGRYPNNPYPNQYPYSYGMPYGCPQGYQPIYTGSYWQGSQYTCVAMNYFSANNYNNLYYQPNYGNYNGQMGYGPAMACDPYAQNSCPGAICQPAPGQRYGFCVR